MDRLTAERVNGIKTGYWTQERKDDLVQRLGLYEDTGLSPADMRILMRQHTATVNDLRFLIQEAEDAAAAMWPGPEKQLAQVALELAYFGKQHPWIFGAKGDKEEEENGEGENQTLRVADTAGPADGPGR